MKKERMTYFHFLLLNIKDFGAAIAKTPANITLKQSRNTVNIHESNFVAYLSVNVILNHPGRDVARVGGTQGGITRCHPFLVQK